MSQINTYEATRCLQLRGDGNPIESNYINTGIPDVNTVALSAWHCYKDFVWFDAEQMASDLHNRRITSVSISLTTTNPGGVYSTGSVPIRFYRTAVKYDSTKAGHINADTLNPALGMTYANPTNEWFLGSWYSESVKAVQTIEDSQLCAGAEAGELVEALCDGCALGSFDIPDKTALKGTYNYRRVSELSITIYSEPLNEVTKPTEVSVMDSEVKQDQPVRIHVSGAEQTEENPITGYYVKKRYQARQSGEWSNWSNSEFIALAGTEGVLETNVSIPGAYWEFSVAATSALNTTDYVAASGSVHVWAKDINKICVFDMTYDDYNGNGSAVLHPTACTVTEDAGGQYELSMTLPLDNFGKLDLLQNGYIVKVMVPVAPTESTALGDSVEVWKNKMSSSQGVYAKAQDPQTITYTYFNVSTNYSKGDKVSILSGIKPQNFQCTRTYPINSDAEWRAAHHPANPAGAAYWTSIPSQKEQPLITTLSPGQEFYKIEELGSWLRIRTYTGMEGYIRTIYCSYVRTETTPAVQPRTAKEQLFRIYSVKVDTKKRTAEANARHVSYDLSGNIVQNCSVKTQTASSAIAYIRNALLEPYDNIITTNLDEQDGTITQDYSWKNPTKALLDPDTGIVGLCRGKLIRDNWDFFILKNTEIDRGVVLSYGKNLKGVTWSRSADALVTRVIPVAKTASNADLYLDDQIYVDSPIIDSWPVIKTERLQVNGKIGEDDGDGGHWTEETLKAHMREKSEQRFSIDHADAQSVEITVDFVLLGDTEEYKQYRGLQHLYMYDMVRVHDDRIGLDQSLQVSKIEWDVIRQRYNKITLGNVFDYGGRVTPGYTIANNGIEFDKLAPSAVERIRNGL